MALAALAGYLAIFWSALYYTRWRRRRQHHASILPGNAGRSREREVLNIKLRSGKTLSVTLKNFHLKVETSAAEPIYEFITGRLSPSGRKTRAGRALAVLYDVGIVASLLGMALGTVLLAMNAFNVVGRLLLSVPLDAIMMSMDQFSKRSVGETTPPTSPGTELYAIIPGVTVPWSHFPLIIITLFAAQIVHEAGHFVSAALESAPLDSVGFALTLFLPSAFVALSSMSENIAHVPRLRIIAAGAWHNLLAWTFLYLLSFSGSEKLWSLLGYDDVSSRGMAVLDVENGSPFSYHLTPGSSIITALDDISLARQDVMGEDDVWSRYLLTPIGEQVPLERGWCVEAKWFNEHSGDCCQAGNHTNLPPTAPVSCFIPSKPVPSFSNSWIYGRCIDPVPLLIDTNPENSKRCRETADCTGGSTEKEMECIRPDVDAQLLRITVETPEKDAYMKTNAIRVVVWGGPRREVWEQVTVSNKLPRWWLLPTWLPTLVSLFLSYFSTLSLSLFFFNLLVLPALDGSELLSTLLLYLAKYPDEEFAPFDIEMEGNRRSRSTRTAASSIKEQLRRRKGFIERCLRYITLALCLISLIGVLLPA